MLKFIKHMGDFYPIGHIELWENNGLCTFTIKGIKGTYLQKFSFTENTEYAVEHLQTVMSRIMEILADDQNVYIDAEYIHRMVAEGFNSPLSVEFKPLVPPNMHIVYDQYYYTHVYSEVSDTLSLVLMDKNTVLRKPKTRMGHRYEFDHAFSKEATALTLRGFNPMLVKPLYRGTTEADLATIITNEVKNCLLQGQKVIDLSSIMMKHALGMGYTTSGVHEVD